jgi:hypothetical protein
MPPFRLQPAVWNTNPGWHLRFCRSTCGLDDRLEFVVYAIWMFSHSVAKLASLRVLAQVPLPRARCDFSEGQSTAAKGFDAVKDYEIHNRPG